MKKIEISHWLYAILTLIVILYCGIFVSESVANNKNTKNITSALESGDVKLTVEGMENGEKLKIKAEKITSSSLVLVIPKGNTELKLGMFQTITINTSQEIQIDLSNAATGEVHVSQSGKRRLFEGSVEIENSSGGISYSYHNAKFGIIIINGNIRYNKSVEATGNKPGSFLYDHL